MLLLGEDTSEKEIQKRDRVKFIVNLAQSNLKFSKSLNIIFMLIHIDLLTVEGFACVPVSM